jgi:hypothetical protein
MRQLQIQPTKRRLTHGGFGCLLCPATSSNTRLAVFALTRGGILFWAEPRGLRRENEMRITKADGF